MQSSSICAKFFLIYSEKVDLLFSTKVSIAFWSKEVKYLLMLSFLSSCRSERIFCLIVSTLFEIILIKFWYLEQFLIYDLHLGHSMYLTEPSEESPFSKHYPKASDSIACPQSSSITNLASGSSSIPNKISNVDLS